MCIKRLKYDCSKQTDYAIDMCTITNENRIKFNDYFLIFKFNEYVKNLGPNLFQEHCNSCNHLWLLTEGECSLWIDKNEYSCSKGSLVTISKNQLQKFSTTNKTNGYIILFPDQLLKEIDYDFYLSINFLFFEFALSPNPITLSNNDYFELLDIIEILYEGLSKINNLLNNDITKSLIKKILQNTEHLKIKNKKIVNERDKDLLKDFNMFLVKNLRYSRSVKYYSDLLAISTKKLNSITKTYWEKTAKEFIEERIIYESKKLLLDTPDTVKQISYSMGFTEPTNFNKFFKKLTATTPLQFRKEYNKGAF